MKWIKTARLSLLAFLVFSTTALAGAGDPDDDTISFYLSKSTFVLLGTVSNEPIGIINQAGVPDYFCKILVQEVFKGDVTQKGKIVDAVIKRFEMSEKDSSPYLKKGSSCILFLKPDPRGWITADLWFGVQQPNAMMVTALRRLSPEK